MYGSPLGPFISYRFVMDLFSISNSFSKLNSSFSISNSNPISNNIEFDVKSDFVDLLQFKKSSCSIFLGLKGLKQVTKPSNLSLHNNRIFKQKRIIQVQSWKLKSHWEILASTKKIILESYFWFWKYWLPKLCLLESKWPQRKIWLCSDFIFISGTCFLLAK